MSVKVTDYTASVLLNNNQDASLFIRLMLDEIHKMAKPITPRDKGNLRKDVLKVTNGKRGSITWPQQYAAAQEVGKTRGRPIVNYTTAGTGKEYASRAVEKALENQDAVARRAFK